MFVYCLIALAGAYAVVAYTVKKNQRSQCKQSQPKLHVDPPTPTTTKTGVAHDDADHLSLVAKLYSMVRTKHSNKNVIQECPLISMGQRLSSSFLQPTDAILIKDADQSTLIIQKDDSNSSGSSCPSYSPTSPPPNYSTISPPRSSPSSATNSTQKNMWGETMFSLHLGEDFPSRSSSNVNSENHQTPLETHMQLQTAASRITHQSMTFPHPPPPSVSLSQHDPQQHHHQQTRHQQQHHPHHQSTQQQHLHQTVGSTSSLTIPSHSTLVHHDVSESVATNGKKSDKSKGFCRLVRKLTPKKSTKQRHSPTKSAIK